MGLARRAIQALAAYSGAGMIRARDLGADGVGEGKLLGLIGAAASAHWIT
jgi:hypothetical protein